MDNSILVVEDDEAIRETMTEILELEGYKVEARENGQVALDYLASTKELPSVILLDLMMPVMDGFEFCENKSHTPFSHIPVVVMSADGHVKQKQNQTQAVAYFKKPIDLDQMMDTLKRVFNGENLNQLTHIT